MKFIFKHCDLGELRDHTQINLYAISEREKQ